MWTLLKHRSTIAEGNEKQKHKQQNKKKPQEPRAEMKNTMLVLANPSSATTGHSSCL